MKYFLTFLSFFFIIVSCQSSKKAAKAPDNIRKAFYRMHPGATILKWNDESPIWEAKYKEGNEKGAVSLNPEGKVTETELVIKEAQLPDPSGIREYIKSNYPHEKAQRFEKVTKADGTITYEIQITGKELVFDANGNFLAIEPD